MDDKYLPSHLRSDEIVSMTECTGLIPTLPDDNEEESYEEIYPIPNQDMANKPVQEDK